MLEEEEELVNSVLRICSPENGLLQAELLAREDLRPYLEEEQAVCDALTASIANAFQETSTAASRTLLGGSVEQHAQYSREAARLQSIYQDSVLSVVRLSHPASVCQCPAGQSSSQSQS